MIVFTIRKREWKNLPKGNNVGVVQQKNIGGGVIEADDGFLYQHLPRVEHVNLPLFATVFLKSNGDANHTEFGGCGFEKTEQDPMMVYRASQPIIDQLGLTLYKSTAVGEGME